MITILHLKFRRINARCLSPILRATGFRFSRDYRWEITRFHASIYWLVDTVGANALADGAKGYTIAQGWEL